MITVYLKRVADKNAPIVVEGKVKGRDSDGFLILETCMRIFHIPMENIAFFYSMKDEANLCEEEARAAFEEEINSDPELKAEYLEKSFDAERR